MIKPVALRDGVAAGTWRFRRAGKTIKVMALPFEPLPKAVLPVLSAEAADVACSLGLEARLAIG